MRDGRDARDEPIGKAVLAADPGRGRAGHDDGSVAYGLQGMFLAWDRAGAP